MKRRSKNLKMPRDPVKHRKLVRKTLRMFHITAQDLEVQVALHRIQHGAWPSLYRACSDAAGRVRPETADEVYRRAHHRLIAHYAASRGKKR